MRTKDENKRIAIRDATIVEVVEGGLSGATIARIATRAGLSQGTIYLYYPTKESLIRQVYVEIKLQVRDTLMNRFVETATSAENIRTLWFALLNYATDHPKHFMFTESVAASNLFDELDVPELANVERDMKSIITRAIDDGTLKAAPYDSLQAVLVAPVNQLSRQMAFTQKRISKKTLEMTFELIWQGIAKS